MSKTDKDNIKEAETAADKENVKDAVPESDTDTEKSSGSDQKKLRSENQKLQKENEKLSESLAALEEKYTRMIAEYDNFRKRAAKERESVYADAYADVINELLPVKDNLELAVKYSEADKFAEGVVMTLNKFDDILAKMDVVAFGEPKDAFDPNLHNAVMHAEDDAFGENEIAEVLLKGYKKGDRVIRYAMVKVAN